MAKTFDIAKTIQWHKDEFPTHFQGMSDEEIVEKIKPFSPKDLDWGIYADPTPKEQESFMEKQQEPDDSPGMVSKLLLMNPNEMLADDYDWAARAYNNSLSGNMYKYMYGKNKYDVEEMPNTWWQDAVGLVLGMLNPVEAALFVTTGGIGAVAGKSVANKMFGKSLQTGLKSIHANRKLYNTTATTAKLAKDKLVRRHLIKEGAIEGALGLGTFSAAGSAIHGYGNQAVEIADGTRDEFDDSLIWADAGKAYMSGAVMAAVGGGLVKTPMAQKFAIASRNATKLGKAGQAVPSKLVMEKLATNPAMQIALESQAFTAFQLLEEAVLHDEAPSMDSWWRKTFSNASVIGGMRAGSKAFRVAFTKEPGNDVSRYFQARRRVYHEGFTGSTRPLGRSEKFIKRGRRNFEDALEQSVAKSKELQSLKEIQKEYEQLPEGIRTPKEVLERIAELESELAASASQEGIVLGKTKRVTELLEKATDDEGIVDISVLTEKQRGELGKTLAETNLWMLQLYETLKTTEDGPAIAREMFKDILGKYPEGQHEKVINTRLNDKIDTHLQLSKILNEGAQGKLDENGRPISKKEGKKFDKEKEKELKELDLKEVKKPLKDMSEKELDKYFDNIEPYLTKEYRGTPEGKQAIMEFSSLLRFILQSKGANKEEILKQLTDKGELKKDVGLRTFVNSPEGKKFIKELKGEKPADKPIEKPVEEMTIEELKNEFSMYNWGKKYKDANPKSQVIMDIMTQAELIKSVIWGRSKRSDKAGSEPITVKPKEQPIEKPKEKTQKQIEDEKVADLASRTGRTPDEIRATKEYQKLDIMSKTGETKLDIEAIDRAIKAEIEKKKTTSEKAVEKATEKILETDPSKKLTKEESGHSDYINEKIDRLNNENISDNNKKIIASVLQDLKAWSTGLDTRAKSTYNTAYRKIIDYAKWLEKNDRGNLSSDNETTLKNLQDYVAQIKRDTPKSTTNARHDALDGIGKLYNSLDVPFRKDIARDISSRKITFGLESRAKGEKIVYLPKIEENIPKVVDKVLELKKDYKTTSKYNIIENDTADILIKTMYGTGIRPEDVVSLRLHPTEKKIRWQEKKKGQKLEAKEKYDPELYDAIKQYMESKGIVEGKSIFRTKIVKTPKGPRGGNSLTAKEINIFVNSALEDAGLEARFWVRETGETGAISEVKGLQAGRIFRAREDAKSIKEFGEFLKHEPGSEATKGYSVPSAEKRAARLPGEVRFTPEQRKARKEFLDKFQKKWNLSDKKLKEANLEKDVLGTFADGIIKVARDEWQPSDLFHEQFHKMKEFAKITNNVPLKKLILQATKLAGKTKEYKQWLKEGNNKKRGKTKSENIEEFIADIVGGKSDRIEFTKGMLPKFNQIMKQIISKVKTAFGVGNFNDYARVLAKKTLKGFDDAGVKYGKKVRQKKVIEKLGLQEEKTKILGKGLRQAMTETFKKLNIVKGEEGYSSSRAAIMRYVSNASNLKDANGNPISYKLEMLNPKLIPEKVGLETHYQNLKNIEATLKDMQPTTMKRKLNLDKWFETLDKVERARITEKNITNAEQKWILEGLGVKDGNIWKTSQKQLNDYAEIVHESRTFDKITESDWLQKLISDNYAKDERFTTWWGRANIEKRRVMYPVYKVLEKAGLTGLSKQMKSHFSAEAGHLGRGYDMFLEDVEKGFTSKHGKFDGIKAKGFNKIKDSLFSIDHRGERFIDNIKFLKENRESLSQTRAGRAEIKRINEAEVFFRKAIKAEFFKLKNEDGTLKGGDLRKYINYNTPEGRVVERYVKFVDYYKNMLQVMLKKNMNDAEYELFVKQGNVKFIEDGIFLTRQTTKDFKKLVNLESKEINELVDSNTRKIRVELAKEEFKTENPTREQIGSIEREVARGKALEQLYDANTFSLEKISSKFLLKRGMKLPEFIKDADGKLVRVYETNFDRTAMTYAIGMSKFLATLEFFPEFANIKGFKTTRGVKEILGKLQTKDKAESEWIKDAFMTRIGIGKSNPYEALTGFVGNYANVLAKVGLSSPTTGVKNLITGNVGTMFAYKTQDMARGLADIIRGEQRGLSKTGKDSISLSHFEEGKFTEFFDKYFFRTGLMKPTERFNRNLALLASKYDQRRMFDILASSKKGDKKYERARNRLLDFYELTPEEIKLVEKYKFNKGNIDKKAFESTRDFIIEGRNHQNALQKMNTMAHVKTQGASADIFMPKWGSGALIRPLTLYKRMAYAATFNTFENVGRAARERNPMKIVMGGLGTYFGGAALLGIFHHVLGQPMPSENDPWYRHIMTTVWKGEMLGILSEIFSPYNSGVSNTLSPAIHENAITLLSQIWAGGLSGVFGEPRTKFASQSVHTYLKKSVASYNALFKFKDKRLNPYNRDMLRFQALYKDYQEDILGIPRKSFEATTLTKYKNTLRDAFNMGTEEEFLKAYVILKYAIATDAYNKGVAWDDGIRRMKNPREAEKFAISQLKSFMKDLNPNPANIRKGMERSTRADKAKFRNWLTGRTSDTLKGSDEKKFAGKYPLLGKMSGKELEARMFQLENEYKMKLKKLKQVAPYYIRKWKDSGEIKSMLDSFSYD